MKLNNQKRWGHGNVYCPSFIYKSNAVNLVYLNKETKEKSYRIFSSGCGLTIEREGLSEEILKRFSLWVGSGWLYIRKGDAKRGFKLISPKKSVGRRAI